ncbi:golgin subfamily A member 3 isoform X1 [Xenopus laevis]|uniref:Golgin subfamily A member 3 isoform X1 n=1 Tax=Xenopus laevis TaxID=8355 RepID=A0A8J1L0E5_XENLA|nr:golgin subfamily A member 3 isoform X1 [Xenopus laevis]
MHLAPITMEQQASPQILLCDALNGERTTVSTFDGKTASIADGIHVTSINSSHSHKEVDNVLISSKDDASSNGPPLHGTEPISSVDSTNNVPITSASPGVAGFSDNLMESSANGVVLKKEALQSLKLSLHMQETDLCSSEAPLPLEREEQIRLQARRRLEEQLKQYRVKRHQERSNHSTPKGRPSSTLDPELMFNPENLPRANTVAMTKEYTFLRTNVPRGPKLGSLGLPSSSKEKKSSRSSKSSSKIRSLADYRTEESEYKNSSPGYSDTSSGSLKPSRGSMTSVVSEISMDSSETFDGLSVAGDNSSELDGSEIGIRQDGNESDSSTYSSASTNRGAYAQATTLKQEANYSVNGQVIAAEDVGHYPSLSEVLQAAATECNAQEQEINGEPRSRRDSISSSISMESSIAGTHDELLQVLKEKMRLEGQLESLTSEASQALKEKTELQAQLAAVSTKLQAELENQEGSQKKQESLSSEVFNLKKSCLDLERAMADLQSSLEVKNSSLASLGNDLQVAEEQYQRLMGKVEELQRIIIQKDNAVHDLRQQTVSLQYQLQQVQLDRSTLTNKLKASKTEIASLQQTRDWYQQQLTFAQAARVRLQSEMANIQAGQMTQAGVLEHLKIENVTLSHQLNETQHRSLKEKERIATQLQNIEADMLDQEAAFHQIQEAKSMVEEDLQKKLEEFEEEKGQLQKLADSAAALELELEQVKLNLHQRDLQLEELQQEHLKILKQLSLTQETLHTKDQSLKDLQMRYDELEGRLLELQSDTASKDDTIEYLQNQKIVLEVALQAAKMEQEGLDHGVRNLQEGTEAAAEVLEKLRQELSIKSCQVETLEKDNATIKKQTQKVKEQLLQQKVMVEAYRRDASSKDQLISELKTTKKKLDSEVKELRQKLLWLQGEKSTAEVEQARVRKEMSQLQQQMEELESNLQAVQKERDEMEIRLQSLQFDKDQMATLTQDNVALKEQVELMQNEAKKAITEQKQRMKRIGSDLTSAQKEMKIKHKAYENAVGILSRRLQEALTEKETAEAELNKLKAQLSDVENNQAFQAKLQTLQNELQTVNHSKAMLERELQEVISLTSQELEEYREKVIELEDELQEARGFRRKIKRLEELNKKLTLELEHERGKLAGLGQSNAALREHSNILEAALAKRESDLVQLNLQVQAVLKRKEEEDRQMKELVQTLQDALQKEKTKVSSLTEQLATAKAEAAHNRRHYRAAALELSEIQKELQAKEQLIQALQTEAVKLQSQDEKNTQELSHFQQELAEAHSQLQLLQKELDENISKKPEINQEVEDLKWQVDQKEHEINAIRQQLDMTEQRNQKELEGVQTLLQNLKLELEAVRDDLTDTQKDKFMLQAKVSELKNSMKTLLQQNQQLKLDLRQGRIKKRKELKSDVTSSNPVTPVKIPDCPVPASLLEELLKPSSANSKEPINNLNNCLRQLKQEMDSLQRQMEEHTITVHESMTSWNQIEGQLQDLSSSGSQAIVNSSLQLTDQNLNNCDPGPAEQ